MILFRVRSKEQRASVICMANGREDAKNQSRDWLVGNPDNYEVTPLTEDNENVKIIFYNFGE